MRVRRAILSLPFVVILSCTSVSTEPRPPFDKAVAAELIGQYILVGLTYRNKATDEVESYIQKHGKVIAVDERLGIVMRNPNTGEEYTLPPDTSRFEKANPGTYRLKNTGEVVIDPDYLAYWIVYK